MKIGFTAKGTDWEARIDARFGRTAYILVYDEETDHLSSFDNEKMRTREHGAGPGTAKVLIDQNVKHLITGNGPGSNTARLLEKAGITVYTGAEKMNVKQAYEKFKENKLNKF